MRCFGTAPKSVVVMLACILGAGTVGGMEIFLAPIVYVDDTGTGGAEGRQPQEDLFKRLGGAAIANGVTLHAVGSSGDSVPRSFLDAARLCESQGYPFLLYGFVKRTEFSSYAEVKLLERERKEVSAAFIAGDDDSHYERLMDDLAAKIAAYVRGDLGMGPPPPSDLPARNVVVLLASAGYWTPTGGDWSQAMAGLVSADVGIRFIPARPLFHIWRQSCFLAVGLDLEYALGTCQPGLESSYLHAAKVRIPVEGFVELGSGHRIGIGLGPLLEVDTLVQARQYGTTVVQTTVAPGASVSILYQYVLSNSVSLGLSNMFDVAFYAKPLFTYSPRLSVAIWLGGGP